MFYLRITLLLVILVDLSSGCRPIVPTKYGLIEGTEDGVSRGGKCFYQFRGIQYAVIPERFESSVEPSKWIGIKSAKTFGVGCNEVTSPETENCLYLNVYTPKLNLSLEELLPVVVYIHGGSFQYNKGDYYGPNYFMDEDVVMVTINYRLGVLGFLSTEDLNSPGNYGLKDQVMALKWTRDNIAAFGGNPDKITLMGQSAGGASITYHLVSPMSRDLFRYAIPQSGTFLGPWALTEKPLRHAKSFARVVGCNDTDSTAAMVNCLKTMPASVIANATLRKEATVKFFEEPLAAFGPTIEPKHPHAFLTESPYEILKSGNFPKVPLLSGLVQEEGIYIWAAYMMFLDHPLVNEARKMLETNFTEVAPTAFYFNERIPPSKLAETAQKVKDFYFRGNFSLANTNETFTQLAHLYSDRIFVAASVRFMNLYAKWAPVYPYLYTFNKFEGLEFNCTELNPLACAAATHAAELDMLFSPLFNQTRVTPEHDNLSRKILKLWTSFISNGKPTATYGSELKFPKINSTNGLRQWYELDVDSRLLDNPFSERIAFWESLNLEDDDFLNCYC